MKAFVIAALIVGTSAPVAAQDRAFPAGSAVVGRETSGVTTARELYAAARYEEALALLNGLSAADRQGGELKVIEQHRAFCLIALGRPQEAEAAIATVVQADPFYQPTEEEVSPRIRSTFADVRQRLLPDIAVAAYARAKQTYDRKEHAQAEREFRDLVRLLEDPQMTGRHADLRTLASGFLELAAAAAAPPPPPKEEPKKEEPPPAPVPPPLPKVYGSQDAGVTPPVTVRQELPPVPATITASARDRGLLEIVIDEQGRVSAMTLRTKIHPVYDTMLLNAAKDWKYRPARANGTAVPYRKLIQFTVAK